MHGVIDIGSNTIRLAVYEVVDGSFNLLFYKKNTAGLASYIIKSGKMSAKGIDKAAFVLNDFKRILDNINLTKVYVFATASLRNITNSEEAIKEITEKTGFNIDLISGEQEGIYDYTGVSVETNLKSGILADIGGGSTEMVLFDNGIVKESVSVPIGSLNLYKKFVSGIMPAETEIKKMKSFINETLSSVKSMNGDKLICCVGGTARASCQLSNLLFEKPHDNRTVSLKNLKQILSDFKENPDAVSRKILKIAPDRIHTLLPGILILTELSEKFGSSSYQVSSYGVREGYLYSKLFLSGKNDD